MKSHSPERKRQNKEGGTIVAREFDIIKRYFSSIGFNPSVQNCLSVPIGDDAAVLRPDFLGDGQQG